MQVTLDALRLTGTFPVLQHVHLMLARRGVHDPAECIRTAPEQYLVLDEPGDAGSCVRLTIAGLHKIEPHARELDLFIGVLRGCVDCYRFRGPDSPSHAQTLEVGATDLIRGAQITQRSLHAIGLFLQAEGVAPICFELQGGSPGGPWRVELGMEIWRYQSIADLERYLRSLARYPGEG
jgi:hypothetical protein